MILEIYLLEESNNNKNTDNDDNQTVLSYYKNQLQTYDFKPLKNLPKFDKVFNTGYIYLIQTNSCIDFQLYNNTSSPVFKVGKTCNLYNRLCDYNSKIYTLHYWLCSDNLGQFESIIINSLKLKPDYMLVFGREYFCGDIATAVQLITDLSLVRLDEN